METLDTPDISQVDSAPPVLRKLEDRVREKVAKRKGTKSALLDPTIIAMIIKAIMDLVSTCKNNNPTPDPAAAIKDMVDRHPVIARVTILRSLNRNGLGNRADTEIYVNAITDLAPEVDNGTLTQIIEVETNFFV